ncbi:MAG TPA: response regulator transcription factor [Blastocatellia bacterium]
MKLLIVDDNARMRGLIRNLVRDLADEIYECASAEEAFAAYSAHQPDWVLMDVEMPVMDGITASRNLIRMFPDARIVMVTRYDDDELRQEARLAGARGYVLKEDLSALGPLLAGTTSISG